MPFFIKTGSYSGHSGSPPPAVPFRGKALTQTHEADQPAPWRIADAPADYIERPLQAIIEIERMVGKVKLSQNQPAPNQQPLINALQGPQ